MINFDTLRDKKLFIATPAYGGSVTAYYNKSMIQLAAICARENIDLYYYNITTESLVQRARNYCVDEFMKRSPASHLIFIDADIEFKPMDVLALAAIAEPDTDKDVVCGPYPLKNIAWEKIKYAVDKGVADNGSDVLSGYATDYVFNIDNSVKTFKLNEPIRVAEAGTGFMCIQRSVFERFQKSYPQYEYTPDHIRSKSFSGDQKVWSYFHTEIDEKTNRYLSEDYWFCRKISDIGMKTWICPWMQMNHVGSYLYEGNLEKQASIGLSYGKMEGLK